MCKSFFLVRCNEIWLSCGLASLGNHSFHIGSTTHLLLIGVDPFIVMVQGRWKSTAFIKYCHNCEDIVPTFFGFSLSSKTSVLASMSTFKQCLISSFNYFLLYGESVLRCLFSQLFGLSLYCGVILPSQPHM